jgi:hypothetical protein
MSLLSFAEDPWKNSHDSYNASVFNIRPAPEFATAEVVVASLYRAVGFDQVSERDVPKSGRDFDRSSIGYRPSPGTPAVGADTWRTILHGVLESPKQPNQSSRRFLQLCPVVPDIALYSGSARLTGNSWNPGALIERMICIGSDTKSDAENLWQRLYESLSVLEGDDIWARWLQGEFERRRRGSRSWAKRDLHVEVDLPEVDKKILEYPAQQFVRDLDAVIGAKRCMTRRQWMSLLEAILRLGSVTHVLWLCDVNHRLWRAIRGVLDGSEPIASNKIAGGIVSCNMPFLAYGNPAVPLVRDHASRYLLARLGINLVLHQLQAASTSIKSLSSCADLHRLLVEVKAKREVLQAANLVGQFDEIRDVQARAVACKKGIGSNLIEFARHTLGQRQTNNESLRSYDQGYILRKRGEHKSAPWVVSLGPVAVLALTHCCLREAAGPRSVNRLCQHLARYGLDVDRDDVSKSELGRRLRMLGLVLDSPDAESGMLLVPPFEELAEPTSQAFS